LQIENGVSGFLVDSAEECAERSLEILKDPGLGKTLGREGKEHARREFLSPRLLRDWLDLLTRLDT
jgi:trehalose synthase